MGSPTGSIRTPTRRYHVLDNMTKPNVSQEEGEKNVSKKLQISESQIPEAFRIPQRNDTTARRSLPLTGSGKRKRKSMKRKGKKKRQTRKRKGKKKKR